MTERPQARWSDETLSAFLDGELPGEEAARLEAELAADPKLRGRVEALRAADAAVRSAYASIAGEPLPDRVLALIDVHAPAAAPSAGVAAMRTSARQALSGPEGRRRRFHVPASVAAGIALAVGFLSAVALYGPRRPDVSDPAGSAGADPAASAGTDPAASVIAGLAASAGAVPPGTRLHDVLEHRASGVAADLPGGATATARLTFVDTAGEYCRQVDVAGAGGSAAVVACRRDGAWRIEVVTLGADGLAPSADVFRPASAPAAPLLDAAIDAMIDGEPLGRSEEQAAISGGWQPSQRPGPAAGPP